MTTANAPLLCLGFLITGCLSPVPINDWPERNQPLFRHAVWIQNGGHFGSGSLIHSSEEHGSYVLTAGHVLQRDLGSIEPGLVVEVGIFAPSHRSPIAGDFARYPARAIAQTGSLPGAPDSHAEEVLAALRLSLDVVQGRDLAVLRLDTERLFEAASIHPGEASSLNNREAQLLAVAPAMYPHLKEARCEEDRVWCLSGIKGNSGAGVFVDGMVVGVYNYGASGAGPELLRDFLAGHPETRFLLE